MDLFGLAIERMLAQSSSDNTEEEQPPQNVGEIVGTSHNPTNNNTQKSRSITININISIGSSSKSSTRNTDYDDYETRMWKRFYRSTGV